MLEGHEACAKALRSQKLPLCPETLDPEPTSPGLVPKVGHLSVGYSLPLHLSVSLQLPVVLLGLLVVLPYEGKVARTEGHPPSRQS